MTAPLREPEAESETIEVWPPIFDLGPELIADRANEARAMRAVAMRRALRRTFTHVVRAIGMFRVD